jgi:hypothetical protein
MVRHHLLGMHSQVVMLPGRNIILPALSSSTSTQNLKVPVTNRKALVSYWHVHWYKSHHPRLVKQIFEEALATNNKFITSSIEII